jgi:hypothetical protein
VPRRVQLLLLVAAAVLAGCQALPRSLPPATERVAPVDDRGGSEMAQVLRYALWLESLPPAEVAAQRRVAERQQQRHDVPVSRLRLALALVAGGGGQAGAVVQARELLAPVADGTLPAAPAVAALAAWLLADWKAGELQWRRQVEALQARNATLEKQLQEIRSIEQQLEQGGAPAGAPSQ